MLHDVAPMVEIRSDIERLWAVKRLGQNRPAWYIFRQKAVCVTSENVDGRAGKPRFDVPQVELVQKTGTRLS